MPALVLTVIVIRLVGWVFVMLVVVLAIADIGVGAGHHCHVGGG